MLHPHTKEDIVNFFKLCGQWLAHQAILTWHKYALELGIMVAWAIAGVALYLGAKPNLDDPVTGNTTKTALIALIITITTLSSFVVWASKKAPPTNPQHQTSEALNIATDALKGCLSSPIIVIEIILAMGTIILCWGWLGKIGGLAALGYSLHLLSHIEFGGGGGHDNSHSAPPATGGDHGHGGGGSAHH